MLYKKKYYDTYIIKILRGISETNDISLQAREYLNSLIIIFSELITMKIFSILLLTGKKIITHKEVKSALFNIFNGILRYNCIREGENSIDLKEIEEKSIVPYSLSKFFLKRHSLPVTKKACIYFSSAIEYIMVEILDIACYNAIFFSSIRIKICDINEAISQDPEILKVMSDNSIYLLNNVELFFPRRTFVKMIKDKISETGLKISKKFTTCLQLYLENYISRILLLSKKNTEHRKRLKINLDDICLTLNSLSIYYLETGE